MYENQTTGWKKVFLSLNLNTTPWKKTRKKKTSMASHLGSGIRERVFNVPGKYQFKPLSSVKFEMWGGGGAGGLDFPNSLPPVNGGGGGAGAYTTGTLPGKCSIFLVVGEGGTSISSPGMGGDGGSSILKVNGIKVVARGGKGGQANGVGGVGGTFFTNCLSIKGVNGQDGEIGNFAGDLRAGNGGSASSGGPGGRGARTLQLIPSPAFSPAATSGVQPGGGGGGGSDLALTTGRGAPGMVIFTYLQENCLPSCC
jgi:hypothetical protein